MKTIVISLVTILMLTSVAIAAEPTSNATIDPKLLEMQDSILTKVDELPGSEPKKEELKEFIRETFKEIDKDYNCRVIGNQVL